MGKKKFEVDFSFEDFNIITVVSAEDEYEAEEKAYKTLDKWGIQTKSFMLYEITIDPVRKT